MTKKVGFSVVTNLQNELINPINSITHQLIYIFANYYFPDDKLEF